MASNTYQFSWVADVGEMIQSDRWTNPVESKLFSACSNRVAYDFQFSLRPTSQHRRELQLYMCLRGGPANAVKVRPYARIVKENTGSPSPVVFRPLEHPHSLSFAKDEWVCFGWRFHAGNRSAETAPLIGSRMDLISRVSQETKLSLQIFLEIPTHAFDIANLLDDPEMPSLLPQDARPETDSERPTDRLYASLLADPGGAFADYKLVSKDKEEFPVHRCVLATASEPLRVMLNSNMLEGTGDAFEIRNASGATVRHFRSFIYRGSLDESISEQIRSLLSLRPPFLPTGCEIQVEAPIVGVGTLVELIELGQMYRGIGGICELEWVRLGPPLSDSEPEEAHPNTFRYRLEVANRFELEQLRWYVCKCLINNLTPENAVESLGLAKAFRLRLLHSVAIRYLYDVWELLGSEARTELGCRAEDLMEILDVKAKAAGVSVTLNAYSNPKNIQESV